nr:alpha/beta hydrolase family protein [Bacteroides fragilis]
MAKGLRHAMEEIMKFPQIKNSPAPVCIKENSGKVID